MGAPSPTGIPEALSSIIAPQEDPAFLMESKYFSHNFTDFLSGQKNGFLVISLLFQFSKLQLKTPKVVTAPAMLNFFPRKFSHFLDLDLFFLLCMHTMLLIFQLYQL